MNWWPVQGHCNMLGKPKTIRIRRRSGNYTYIRIRRRSGNYVHQDQKEEWELRTSGSEGGVSSTYAFVCTGVSHVRMHTRTYTHTCMHAHTHTHMHTHTRMHTHTCTHTHTHTHIHTHILSKGERGVVPPSYGIGCCND